MCPQPLAVPIHSIQDTFRTWCKSSSSLLDEVIDLLPFRLSTIKGSCLLGRRTAFLPNHVSFLTLDHCVPDRSASLPPLVLLIF